MIPSKFKELISNRAIDDPLSLSFPIFGLLIPYSISSYFELSVGGRVSDAQ